MKRHGMNILFSDKTLLGLAAAIVTVIIFTVTSFVYNGNIKDKNDRLNIQLERILNIENDVGRLIKEVNSKEKKISKMRAAGIVPTLEQILKKLGLKAISIKPLGKKKADAFTEENAELEIKNLDLNRIVNMLYMIKTSRVPMKIKAASIKTAFEDPDKFIIKLTVSRLSK